LSEPLLSTSPSLIWIKARLTVNHATEAFVTDHEDLCGELLSLKDSNLDASKKCNIYHSFIASEFGVLGENNHRKIPDCVVSSIHVICPSSDGNYTGFWQA
jgi:hypothetical protein